MSKKIYHEALEIERAQLRGQILRLRPSAGALNNPDRLRRAQNTQRLERRLRAVAESLRKLEHQPAGFRGDVMADLQWISDALASSFRQFAERLDTVESANWRRAEHEGA
jgi:hypothetical protein